MLPKIRIWYIQIEGLFWSERLYKINYLFVSVGTFATWLSRFRTTVSISISCTEISGVPMTLVAGKSQSIMIRLIFLLVLTESQMPQYIVFPTSCHIIAQVRRIWCKSAAMDGLRCRAIRMDALSVSHTNTIFVRNSIDQLLLIRGSAVCRTPCANGGKCVRPDVCQCPAGFDGKYCETDRNECAEQKPCDQHCYNTFGSYYCTCRDGFVLLADRESCRRAEAGATAFEARDMENDVEPDFSDKIRAIENVRGRFYCLKQMCIFLVILYRKCKPRKG